MISFGCDHGLHPSPSRTLLRWFLASASEPTEAPGHNANNTHHAEHLGPGGYEYDFVNQIVVLVLSVWKLTGVLGNMMQQEAEKGTQPASQ